MVIAERLGLGGKDLYRQARAIWRMASQGDSRAQNGVAQLDAGTKTIHAAYKDLRRRDRFTTDFRPTPYDVWAFRHDRAFGIPHPGSIPAAIIAHALHYFTPPGGLVVDPMAGGGTTLDVCQSMGAAASPTTLIRHGRRSCAMTSGKGFPPRPWDATSSSATPRITPCWPGCMRLIVLPQHHCKGGLPFCMN